MKDSELVIRKCLCNVLDDALRPETIDMGRSLVDHYGITSLQMVMLMTSVCEDADVPLTSFTENDLAAIETPRDMANALQRVRTGGNRNAMG